MWKKFQYYNQAYSKGKESFGGWKFCVLKQSALLHQQSGSTLLSKVRSLSSWNYCTGPTHSPNEHAARVKTNWNLFAFYWNKKWQATNYLFIQSLLIHKITSSQTPTRTYVIWAAMSGTISVPTKGHLNFHEGTWIAFPALLRTTAEVL